MKKAFLLFFLGTVVFAALVRFSPLGFLLSSLAGIGAIILARIVINAAGQGETKTGRTSSGGTPGKRNVESVVREGVNKIREISNRTRMIRNNAVAAKIREICKTGMEIFDYLQKNPKDLNKARDFTLYYLDATKNIVDQYAELSSVKDRTPEIDATLAKVEGMLESIKWTYEKQLACMYEDDLIDLNAEITLLKKTMELEK